MIIPERDQQAEEPEGEPGPERAHVDEGAPDEHQPAHAEERERHERRRGAEPFVEPVRDVAADGTAVPAEPQHGGETRPVATRPSPQSSGW